MKRMERVCPETDVLAAWVEGSLAPEERGRVKAHLAACDDCRRTASLAATLEPAEAEAAVDDLFVQRLATASRRRPRWPWAAAAAALIVVGTAVLMEGPPAPAPPPQPPPVVKAAAPPIPLRPVVEPTAALPEPPAPAPRPAPPPAVVEDPKPTVVVPPPPTPDALKPLPKVATPVPPKPSTETDLASVFTPVFAVDPTGDLWLRRDGAEAAKAGAFERVAWKDVFVGRSESAAFTLDARASVVLEKGAEAAVSWVKADAAFRLDLVRGPVLVDTEGQAQKWLFTAGPARVAFPELSGRLSVEARGDGLAVVLLEGKGVVEAGRARLGVEPGREVVLSREGKIDVRKSAPVADRLARLLKGRPKASTAFAAGFEERKDVVMPFPYTVMMGRVVSTPAGAWLEAAPALAISGFPLTAALQPDRAIAATEGMVLRFRYRTNLPLLVVKVLEPAADGKGREYGVEMPVRARSAGWMEAELPLASLTDEGVPLVPSTSIRELRIQGMSAGSKAGLLEVDAVQFLRRAR